MKWSEFSETAAKYYLRVAIMLFIYGILSLAIYYIRSLPPESISQVAFTAALFGINLIAISYIMWISNYNLGPIEPWHISLIGIIIGIVVSIYMYIMGYKINDNTFIQNIFIVNAAIIVIIYPLFFAYLKCTNPPKQKVVLKKSDVNEA